MIFISNHVENGDFKLFFKLSGVDLRSS